MATIDHDFLRAALAGYEHRLAEIDQQIAKLRRRTDHAVVAPAPVKKRTMSAAARKRISLRMKRRWAKAKKAGRKRLG